MNALITPDVIESYFHCRRKAYLKAAGESGVTHDFESHQNEIASAIKQAINDRIAVKNAPTDVRHCVAMTPTVLRSGVLYILDATLRTPEFHLTFDGLRFIPRDSSNAKAHYIPISYFPQRNLRKEQKLLLASYALILGEAQECNVNSGLVFFGPDFRSTSLRLQKLLPDATRALRELRQLLEASDPPPVLINNHCAVCEYRKQCNEQAIRDDNISLLRGLGEKEIKAHSRKGILTITQLAHTFRPRRKGNRAGLVKRRYHALQAMAIRDGATYVLGVPEIPSTPVNIYVDVESWLDTKSIYSIGAIVDTGTSQTEHSFWAKDASDERTICNAFLDLISAHGDYTLFAYGAHEKKCFARMRGQIRRKRLFDGMMQRLVNVLSVVYSHIYFPVYSNSLKDIGRHLGCSWSDADPSGIRCFVWRMKWEATLNPTWKDRIIEYNMEDCRALKSVTEFAMRIRQEATLQSDGRAHGGGTYTWVHDIDSLVRPKKWGPVDFVHPDFDAVNRCAYFDYQRERVYVRTSKVVRRDVNAKRKQTKKHKNATLRISEQVVVNSTTCPSCKSKNLVRGLKYRDIGNLPRQVKRPRAKRAFDLVVSPSGIRRKVIQCQTSFHRCEDCGDVFVPWRHQRLAKHFHGLMSWVMYQHVAHRISMKKIEVMLREFFGLQVLDGEIARIKSQMAQYYKSTYRDLLRRLLSGPVLHVDETEVKLHNSKAYVWVFANMEEVVYMHRPTRQAHFLKKMLDSFDGVLVTDFYSAYDSLNCRQQKCLIHLMRDMNQELLANPFDKELQSVTQPFGSLLRSAVESIDKHGLKRRYLKKHDWEIGKFFADLDQMVLVSDAAKSLQERLIKNRSKLFTFISADGVSWNNNCAENAIKHFAYYRHNHKGQLTERGLNDYLVLLSLFQTCRYKGVSFLRFMLSKQRLLLHPLKRKSRKSRLMKVEVYPKGFTPLWATASGSSDVPEHD